MSTGDVVVTARTLSIRELPRSERPRERLVALGPSALSSAELLAVLLGSGTSGGSALQVAQALLAGAGGSLRRMAMQPVAALTSTCGVGMTRAVTVHAALEIGRRLAAEVREDGAPVRSPRDVARHYAPRLEDLPVEEFPLATISAKSPAASARPRCTSEIRARRGVALLSAKDGDLALSWRECLRSGRECLP